MSLPFYVCILSRTDLSSNARVPQLTRKGFFSGCMKIWLESDWAWFEHFHVVSQVLDWSSNPALMTHIDLPYKKGHSFEVPPTERCSLTFSMWCDCVPQFLAESVKDRSGLMLHEVNWRILAALASIENHLSLLPQWPRVDNIIIKMLNSVIS